MSTPPFKPKRSQVNLDDDDEETPPMVPTPHKHVTFGVERRQSAMIRDPYVAIVLSQVGKQSAHQYRFPPNGHTSPVDAPSNLLVAFHPSPSSLFPP